MLRTRKTSRRGLIQVILWTIKLQKWKHGSGEGWQAKLWILFFQAGVRCFFFKEQELGSIVFVEHRFKENNGQHIEEWLL